ncbi:MADF domain [Cinara cedri]|uniref:MADF domain n=1 Tax=Cinara cedri TaxID=506608 RepID=A0A5E4MD09_9HEMI|nr:MADF domain [Cinara cedri]
MDGNQTLRFIEAYKAAKLIWDANHTDYCNKIKRNGALERVANEFNTGVSVVKIKIKNLRSYFPKERQKSLKRKSGSGADETNVSSWFAYAPLSFLLRIVRRLKKQ